MNKSSNVAIVGLGAMGSAAAYHLAKRGVSVLGLDRFTPPHTLGSSHGRTRIIRQAYFEHPLYVPLVQRAYELWADLASETNEKLLQQTGGLMIGPPEGELIAGARQSAEIHQLPHEILSAEEIHGRFPAFRLSDEMIALWEPRAGILFPEKCVQAHLDLARRHGADLHVEEPVLRWEVHDGWVRIATARGNYRAKWLILTAGAWLNALVPELELPLTVERQVQFWFEPIKNRELFQSANFPIFIWEYENNRFIYGFPDLGDGVKVACHHEGKITSPDGVDRCVKAEEVETMRASLRKTLSQANGPLRDASVCLYTNTPDSHFLIDAHPRYPNVLLVSPCSGHGFKFSSVIGEILADLIAQGCSEFDLSPFQLGRFLSTDHRAG